MSYLHKTLEKNLRRLMAGTALSQKDLANKAGVDETQLGRYLNGRHLPRLDQLVKLAEALEVSPFILLMNDDEQQRWGSASPKMPPNVTREEIEAMKNDIKELKGKKNPTAVKNEENDK